MHRRLPVRAIVVVGALSPVVLTGLIACSGPATTAGNGPGQPSALHISTAAAVQGPSPCELSAGERARVPGLLAEGRLDRTLRVISHADTLCPATAPETRGALVSVLAELGKSDEARRLADTIDADKSSPEAARTAAREARAGLAALDAKPKDAGAREAMEKAYRGARQAVAEKKLAEAKKGFLEAWSLGRPHPRALHEAGRCAKELGDRVEAQKLFDRALAELEAGGAQKVTVDASFQLDDGIGLMALSADGQTVALAAGNEVSIRDLREGARERVRLQGHKGELVDVAVSSIGTREKGHTASVLDVALSPDGAVVATASRDKTLRLWSAVTGAELHRLEGHTKEVRAVTFSPDGQTLASGSEEGKIRIWNVAAGTVAKTLDLAPGYITELAFSPDGKTLASGSVDDTVQIWDVATGTRKRELTKAGSGYSGHGGIHRLVFTPDGKLLEAALVNEGVATWDLATGAAKAGRIFRPDDPQAGSLQLRALSPDGRTAITGANGAALWDVATGKKKRTFAPPEEDFDAAAFSGDGKTIVWTGGSHLHVWNSVTGAETVHLLGGSSPPVGGLAFSPDGKALGTSMDDGTVRLWSGVKGAEVRTLPGHEGRPVSQSITFSLDGSQLATGELMRGEGGSHGVRLWSRATGTQVAKLESLTFYPDELAFSTDGKVVLIADPYGLTLWDTATGKTTKKLARDNGAGHYFGFSPDRKKLARDGVSSLLVWDIESEKRLSMTPAVAGDKGQIIAMAFSPAGDLLASSTEKNGPYLWNAADGSAVRTLVGHTGAVTSVAFSPGQKLLASASSDGTVRLWDVATGAEKRKLDAPGVVSLAFSTYALAWRASDRTIRLSNADGGRVVVLRVLPKRDAAYAVMDGAVELLGSEAEAASGDVVCRAGALSFPLDLCRERFETPGLLAAALGGGVESP